MSWLPEWFPFALFSAWSLTSLVSSAARFRRWHRYQREVWLLTDSIKHLMTSAAFFLAAIVTGPHPLDDYRWLISYSRLLWLSALIPFLIGSFFDWRSLARIEREQGR